jgi:hypothetical protein
MAMLMNSTQRAAPAGWAFGRDLMRPVPFPSQSKGFPNFRSPKSAVDDYVEKTMTVGEIDPEPAIQTAGVEAPIHQRVVPLDHHEPFALQTIHESVYCYKPFT